MSSYLRKTGMEARDFSVRLHWWDDDQKCIWFGCVDDNSFIYDANTHKYAIGEAGSNDFGEYDTFMEMLEAYLKYGYELGANC